MKKQQSTMEGWEVALMERQNNALRALWSMLVEQMDEWTSEIDVQLIYDAAVTEGLMEFVPYDPAKHGEDMDVGPGEEIYVLTDFGKGCRPHRPKGAT